MLLSDLQHHVINGINPLGDPVEWQAVQQIITPARGLNTSECLAVYRNNITSARVRALEAIYPVCQAVLGEECFRAVARNFSWTRADSSADLNVYGNLFPEYLGAHEGSNLSRLPYLQDLARLEWHWHAAYYASDNIPFPYESFAVASAQPERLCFTLAPGLSLLETDYPVREIWRRHRTREHTESVPGLEGPEYLCIHRTGRTIQVTQIDKEIYGLLENIQKGHTLEQLGSTDRPDESLVQLLPALTRRCWVTGFTMEAD